MYSHRLSAFGKDDLKRAGVGVGGEGLWGKG